MFQCRGKESNLRRPVLQTGALPPELPRHEVDRAGLEPATPEISPQCSTQLSYRSMEQAAEESNPAYRRIWSPASLPRAQPTVPKAGFEPARPQGGTGLSDQRVYQLHHFGVAGGEGIEPPACLYARRRFSPRGESSRAGSQFELVLVTSFRPAEPPIGALVFTSTGRRKRRG